MAKKQTIILLPPSEGKREGGDHPPLTKLSPVTKVILNKLKQINVPLQQVYGVKLRKSEAAHQMNLSISTSPTLPAIERYKGVVVRALDYPTLSDPTLCHRRVYFVSPLFGLIRADQWIPNYRLKMDKMGAATLWRETITKKLQPFYVIDLLPLPHKSAVVYEEGITVHFLLIKDGVKKRSGHSGKYIKGRFARWLLENNLPSVSEFSAFQEEGFLWDGKAFVKKITA